MGPTAARDLFSLPAGSVQIRPHLSRGILQPSQGATPECRTCWIIFQTPICVGSFSNANEPQTFKQAYVMGPTAARDLFSLPDDTKPSLDSGDKRHAFTNQGN